jgi:hypothetical protein
MFHNMCQSIEMHAVAWNAGIASCAEQVVVRQHGTQELCVHMLTRACWCGREHRCQRRQRSAGTPVRLTTEGSDRQGSPPWHQVRGSADAKVRGCACSLITASPSVRVQRISQATAM